MYQEKLIGHKEIDGGLNQTNHDIIQSSNIDQPQITFCKITVIFYSCCLLIQQIK